MSEPVRVHWRLRRSIGCGYETAVSAMRSFRELRPAQLPALHAVGDPGGTPGLGPILSPVFIFAAAACGQAATWRRSTWFDMVHSN